MMNDNGPRILISRLSAIGDCVLTTPVLCALRKHFPSAHIAWVTEPGPASLLEGHACLDELIPVRKRWFKSPRHVRALRARLRQSRFEIAIDPQSLTKSALVGWLSGAQVRIGFDKPRGRELSRWLNCELVAPQADHLVDAQLELLEPLGIDAPSVEFQMPRQAAAEKKIDEMIRGLHLGCDFVVINPGAGWDSRLWPAERFGRVARHLGHEFQLPALVAWSGQRELAWAETIVARSGGHAMVAPKSSLPELVALMRRGRLFLGSDTGPLHIAAAVGTPCVSLHGTTRREASGPYGAQHIALQKRYQAGTSRQRRRADNAAMREIEVDTVVDACARVLQLRRSTRSTTQAA